ncbi:MAG: 30S ribosomal protein S7 [[Candidatus Thermochlorobacteriaceae] bacterium GBChlB]|jgi:small subunit ribosomal protein S7|nr:MAG: 30S ribosomal protein S7 [[Candidatus Thermochlorobacteriaceae] bacterium GBChlB]
MSRKKSTSRRPIEPDAKYNDPVVGRLVNTIMEGGKKNIARKIVYGAFDIIERKTQEAGVEVFRKAVANVAPVVEVRGKRIGGATYQIPMEVRADRRMALAMRWLKTYSANRGGKTMSDKLAAELIDASNNQGNAVKKKEEIHKMADANKAFSHFRF